MKAFESTPSNVRSIFAEKKQYDLFSNNLPGVSPDSTIMLIYCDLKAGKVLTTLDALKEYKTVNLGKYVSDLRLKYGVNVRDRWVDLPISKKRVKEYFI